MKLRVLLAVGLLATASAAAGSESVTSAERYDALLRGAQQSDLFSPSRYSLIGAPAVISFVPVYDLGNVSDQFARDNEEADAQASPRQQ
jgi:hypothetical protein